MGSIYRYFPSKADLVEAVRANRLSDLSEALLLGRVALDEELRRRSMVASPVAALVRVIHAGRLWIDVCRARGSPADLVRSLLNTCTSQDERILGVVADPLGQVLDAAGAAGALEPGDTARRSAVLLAVLEDSNRLGPRDDGLANRLMGCLLVAWGADPDHLAAADSLLQGVDAEGIGNA